MVGPVLAQELMLGSRRGRHHVFRRIYTGWLMLQLVTFYWLYAIQSNLIAHALMGNQKITPDVAGHISAQFTQMWIWQQMILLVLVTPALTAGAITDEKSRGTLQYLFAADLSSSEIIVGKLVGRLGLVAALALAVLPLICFIGVFGGVTPILIVAFLAVMVMPVIAMASASLLASVWSKQTRDAVLGVYICGLAAYLLLWGTGLLFLFDPVYVLDAAWGENGDARELFKRLLVTTLTWGAVTIICLAVASWRLRPAYLRQLEGGSRPKRVRWWRVQRASVPDEPIRWKERHVEGVAPLASLRRVPRWLGMLGIFAVTLISSVSILVSHLQGPVNLNELGTIVANLDFRRLIGLFYPAHEAFLAQAVLALLVATLLVGVRCSGAITGERERQTWEALLLTPLPVRSMIRGKLWGIVGAASPYFLAYAVPAITLSLLGGFAAFLQTTVCFAVTWLAVGFIGATGLWCSARFKSSWRSLMATAGIGYITGFILFGVAQILAGIVFLAILATLGLIDLAYGTNGVLAKGFLSLIGVYSIVVQLALVVVLLVATWFFLRNTQSYIAARERVRHWKEEPAPVRRKRVEAPAPSNASGDTHERSHVPRTAEH